jgi:hypothetical protein
LFPPDSDADIAVFETSEKLTQPYEVNVAEQGGGVTMGQQVWFLGYPFGLHSHFSDLEVPFIKRGTMSAMDTTNPRGVVLYIDGFNNPGFSGGPILFWNFTTHVIEIIGVVKGYRTDVARVVVNGQAVDVPILVNSGILIGYSIEHAIEAIEQGQAHP